MLTARAGGSKNPDVQRWPRPSWAPGCGPPAHSGEAGSRKALGSLMAGAAVARPLEVGAAEEVGRVWLERLEKRSDFHAHPILGSGPATHSTPASDSC